MVAHKIYRRKHYHLMLTISIFISVFMGTLFVGSGIMMMRNNLKDGLMTIGIFIGGLTFIWSHSLAKVHAIVLYVDGRIEFRRPLPGWTQCMHVNAIQAIYRPSWWKALPPYTARAIHFMHTNGMITLDQYYHFAHLKDLFTTLQTMNPAIVFEGLDNYIGKTASR